MKLFAKLLLTLLVLAGILPFTILKGPDGRPLMSFSDLKLPGVSAPEIPASIENAIPDLPGINSGEDVIYRWRDKDGILQFTNTPPPEGVEYTAKGYDPNTNLIQSVELPKEEPEQDDKVEPGQKKNFELKSPYSPEAVEKLFDDAEKVQKLINDRYKKQEEIFNGKAD